MDPHAANFVDGVAFAVVCAAIGFVLFSSFSRRGLTMRKWLLVFVIVALAMAVKALVGR